MCGRDSLAALELGEVFALEKHLEGRPDGRRRCKRAVHIDSSKGEPGSDWLINVYNWMGVQSSKFNVQHVALTVYNWDDDGGCTLWSVSFGTCA